MGEQRRQGKADPLAVVGIGASAGGLEACQTVFQRLPIDTGAAFVVVQHVDPLHSSALPELLGRCTRMPVVAAADGMRIERDRVYVIPPNVTLTIAEGVLRTEAPREPRGLRLPVDAFFHSLAKDFGWLAVAVVLSGTGADGSVGVRSVKEAGGIVFAQDPSTARYDGMPMSAVTTGIVDQVLPLERIPGALVHYLQHLRGVKPPNGEAADSEHLGPICAVVEEETGHDFSRYKPSTLLRRVRRRMRVLAIEMEADYLRHLRGDPAEAQALLRDFLIGVTQFFRDPAAFEGLAREVIEPLVAANARPTGQIRAWVPACSTGEEAFTVAMLLREACQRHTCPPQVTIFATDIDRHALDVARLGRYPESVAAQLTPERIERHFIQEDGVLQVSKAVREMCIFSLHNILTDPPFARLNLITCRNLFIFLEPELQRKLVPLFHYSLRAGGYLFLGPSETLVADEDLFRTVDKKLRIFQATEAPIRATPDMSLGRHLRAFRSEDLAFRQTPRRERDVRTTLERALLETHAPPGVVVDANNRVLYFTGKTGRYLQQPGGMPTAEIVEIVCPELRLELRTALHKARKTNAEVLQQGLQVTTDGQLQELDLVVRPLADDDDTRGMMLVVFRERGPVRPASTGPPRPAAPDTEAVTRLEGELRAMREHLQSTVEELEGSNQEMRLSNEELLSLNEELQSTNEEMQTSKEELQSVNEELETVNTELRNKIEELDSASGDLQNFFQSTEIAMIFLDRELRIKRFTPATRALFRVVSTDVHRPITDFAPRFGDGNLVGDLQDVLRTLRMREHEVQLGDGDAWYLLRILPYKTVDNMIAGLVLTFFDITELKRAQEQRAQLAALVETSQDAILGASLDRTILAWNQGAERTYGYTAAEMVGRSADVLTPEAHREELARAWDRVARGARIEPFESQQVHKDGRVLTVQLGLSEVLDRAGRIVGVSASARDIGALKLVEAELRAARDELEQRVHLRTAELEEANAKLLREVRERRQAVKARDKDRRLLNAILEQAATGIVAIDGRGSVLFANAAARRMLGFGSDALPASLADPVWSQLESPDGTPLVGPRPLTSALAGERIVGYQMHVRRRDGGELDALVSAAPVRTETGAITGAVAVYVDVTERLREEAAARRTEEEYRVMFELANVGKARLEVTEGRVERANRKMYELLGRTPEELARIPLVQLVHEQDREGFVAALSELGRGKLEEYNAEIRLLRPDGAPMWVQAAIAPCRVAGEQVWLAGVFNDVSDRKLLQAQLEQARKLEGIGRLAGGIAHDFNNLLTAIVGYTDVTLRQVQDPRAQANLEQVRVACKRATDLTARLLAFARKQVIEPRVIDVNEMATRTEQLLRRLIEPNIEVRLELAPEPLKVRVDPGQLEEAVLNLALNARDAMLSGGTLTLAVARREIASGGGPRLPLELADGSYVTLRVSDTGVGMSADEMQRCFEPFYTTKELGKGTGLGLATVYGVVRQAGGHIATESRPGQGTSFTLYLPLAGEDAVAPPQELVPVGGEPGGSETILVVEDEPILLDLAASALADYGYTVLEARDGQQALRLLEDRAGAVDAVITDVLMPKMGGRELAEAVRARWPDLPVLFVSGYSEGAIGDGVFLEKPYTPNELERKLRAMLDTARARRTAPA